MARYALYRSLTVTALPAVLSHVTRVSPGRKNIALQTCRHAHCNIRQENPFVNVSEEVREAIETRKPVVALETTIYTHGG